MSEERKVINPRIDVRAQFAFLRLFKSSDPDESQAAVELFDAVDTGTITGIYGDDLRVAAQLAEKRGTVRWELVPDGSDAIVLDDEREGAPVLIFREQAGGKPRLDWALVSAWREYRQVPQPLDLQEVAITTVRGPILQDHGKFEWYVTFSLPLATPVEGWLIQELYIENVYEVGDRHYWECWRVPAKKSEPTDRLDTGEDDKYISIDTPGTEPAQGWRRHVGVIRFYPGPLPPEFGPDLPGHHFYESPAQPLVWTGGGTRHDCYSKWDNQRGVNGLVAYAGTKMLRRGSRVKFRPRSNGP
jgi:hypothetical protein